MSPPVEGSSGERDRHHAVGLLTTVPVCLRDPGVAPHDDKAIALTFDDVVSTLTHHQGRVHAFALTELEVSCPITGIVAYCARAVIGHADANRGSSFRVVSIR